jgi:hypothetical protein
MGLPLVIVLCVAPFALGCALAIRRLKWYVWSGLFLGEPLAAVIAYEIINPDPGCTSDCPGQLFGGFTIVFTTAGWWAGLITGLWVGWAKGPRPT